MNTAVLKIMSRVVLADRKIKIKLLGDSITHGVGGTGFEQNGELIAEDFRRNPDGYCWAKLFFEHMESHYNCAVVNNGCTGTKIEFIIKHFDTLVEKDDDIIICTIGTNNRAQLFSDAPRRTREAHLKLVYSSILELYGMFKAAGKDVIFVANIPASLQNEKDGDHYWRVIHMNDINDLYMKASVECGFPLISLYTRFMEYCDMRGVELDTLLSDGLHPNNEGYTVMYRLLMRELGLGVKV